MSDDYAMKVEAEETTDVTDDEQQTPAQPVYATATASPTQATPVAQATPAYAATPVASATPVATATPATTAQPTYFSGNIAMTAVATAPAPQGLSVSLKVTTPFKPDTKDPVVWGWMAGVAASCLMIFGLFAVSHTPANFLICFIGVIELVMHSWFFCCGRQLPEATLDNFTNVLYMGIMHITGAILGFIIGATASTFFGIGGWHGFICAIDLLTGFACVVFYFLKKRQALAAAQANNGAGLASQDGVAVVVDDN